MSAALLVAAGLFTACSGHETDEPVVEKPDMIEMSDENTTRDFTAQGGTWQIDFTSSKDWTATKSVSLVAEWYHFTPGQGKAKKRCEQTLQVKRLEAGGSYPEQRDK